MFHYAINTDINIELNNCGRFILISVHLQDLLCACETLYIIILMKTCSDFNCSGRSRNFLSRGRYFIIKMDVVPPSSHL